MGGGSGRRGGGGGWSGWGSQGGCERRIEVFEKIHKKMGGGESGGVQVGGFRVVGGGGRVGLGVRVDVNGEVKVL